MLKAKNPYEAQKNVDSKFYELINSSAWTSLEMNYPLWQGSFGFRVRDRENLIRENRKKKIRQVLGEAIVLPSTRERPRLYIGKLGFINIDAYLTPRLPPEKLDVSNILVQAGNSATEYRLAFKNRKAMIAGSVKNGDYLFKNVPIGETVIVIGTYTQGKNIYLGTRDILVKKGFNDINVELDYKAYEELEDFKWALKEL